MKNGWTGGQYSLFRAIFGTYLLIHFVHLIGWGKEVFSNQGVLSDGSESPLLRIFPNLFLLSDSPAFVTAGLVTASVLSLFFAAGKWDRLAAVGLWFLWASLFGRNPLIANPGLPYVGWLLLAHAFLPRAPFGSVEALGRTDPGGDWKMVPSIYCVAWILLALGYTYSGYAKLSSASWLDGTALARVLENPLARPTFLREWLLELPGGLLKAATWGALALELLYAPMALVKRLRPLIWLAMVAMHVALIVLFDFADLTVGMLMIHFFTFDPGWIPSKAIGSLRLFYDGTCALCHGTIRMVLAEDRAQVFGFAPLDSDVFREAVPEEERNALPDSVVLVSPDGVLRMRSEAVVYILYGLGGLWRVLAVLLRAIPRPLRDMGYDFVARIRHRVFGRRPEACPMMPESLRKRWLT